MALIELKNITKIYGKDEFSTVALSDVNLNVEQGDFWSIMGPSGSGKSTLLNILGCMDVATEGEYILKGKNINQLKRNQLSKVRNETVSFVFQNFALLNDYTVYDNIQLPLNCQKLSKKQKRERIEYYMKRLGIEKLAKKKPTQISGGQQQRVAIARALVTQPDIILADEPTGALDQKTGEELMQLLLEINKEGKTIIIVTHDKKVAQVAKNQLFIRDGKATMEENI